MKTHENQIVDYPKGARIEAIREIPLCSPRQNYYADPLPQGTRGTVTAHTDDGRAWINFDSHGQDGFGHTFEQPEKYIRVVCTHRDDNCPANHEQATTEFDQVFDQMEAPEYPATCDNCGEVGTNASMEQHECDEHDAPAAPERGDHNDKMYTKTSRQTRQHIHTCMFCGQSGTEMSDEQHSTLIAQQSQQLLPLRPVTSPTACYCAVMKSEKCWHCEARELITTIEQDQITSRTTSEQEGRR